MAKITDPQGIHFARQFYGSDLNWSIDEKTRQVLFSRKTAFADNDGGQAGKVYTVCAVEVLEEGGFLQYVEGFKYPKRLHALEEKVKMTTMVKRMIPELIGADFDVSFIKKTRVPNWFNRILAVIFWRTHARQVVRWMQYQLRDTQPNNPKWYQQPVREIYRVIGYEPLRDVVCSFMENDFAYRLRVQDGVAEIDKELLREDSVKEIDRLANLVFSRELGTGGLAKFKKFWPWLRLYFLFDKRLLNYIKKVLLEIDIDQVKPSIEDRYWMTFYEDYDFMGLNKEERLKLRETL